jgi:pimeloyl-ACP methyl ester carboxylesterase
MVNDLVVVVPGIGGSALYRDNKPLWDPTLGGLVNALKTWGGSITSLTLPPGIGDNPPDDGVHAPHMVEDVHVIPGIWTPIRGYTALLQRLDKLGFTEQAGNLLLLPYDWRTSIRRIVATHTPDIDNALERWRASNPANTDARIVFVAHSLGGLIARHYTTTHPAEVRKVITLGTPSRGSMKALQVITDGIGQHWGWLQDTTLALANSLPSLHQMLPAYPCIDTDGNYENFAFLDANHPVNRLNSTMAGDGMDRTQFGGHGGS